MRSKTRFSNRLDKIFWLLIQLLPIIVYFIGNFHAATATDFFTFVNDFSPFTFIENILNDITQTAFGTTFEINGYLSYCVAIEIFHVLFDVVVFIPRLAHKWIAKAVQDE